jgi:hypothetical protein
MLAQYSSFLDLYELTASLFLILLRNRHFNTIPGPPPHLTLLNSDLNRLSLLNIATTLSSLLYTPSLLACSAAPCVGLVAGATDIPALKAVRTVAPNMWILCPGVGAQGGDAQVRTREESDELH